MGGLPCAVPPSFVAAVGHDSVTCVLPEGQGAFAADAVIEVEDKR